MIFLDGFEMPSCCERCNFLDSFGYCLAYRNKHSKIVPFEEETNGRQKWCPLKEVAEIEISVRDYKGHTVIEKARVDYDQN